jgi:hypothetical protein
MGLRSKTLVNALTGLYLVGCISKDPQDMAKAPRKPTPGHLSRAGKDMHSPNKKVRQEAAEVLAVTPRKSRSKTPRK